MFARSLAVSSLALAAASGVALGFLPLGAALPSALSLAFGAVAILAWRDHEIVRDQPARRLAPALQHPAGALPREVSREPDPASRPKGAAKPAAIQPASDFWRAPETNHRFKAGDRVEFVFDSWESGAMTLRGAIEHLYPDLGARIACDNGDDYYVPTNCLIFVGGLA